jgi:hypothetical protein
MEVLMAKTPITKRQKAKLKEHSVHHTPKHMTGMRKAMKKGSTFTEAHIVAKKKKKAKA